MVKMQTQKKETNLQTAPSKLLIISLLSKNKNRDTLGFKSRQELNTTDNFPSKKEIIATHKTDQKREIRSQTP